MIASILYWKMATFRCLVYMFIVGIASFLGQTEAYTGEEWATLSVFAEVRIYLITGSAMLGVLLAFLDQTMSKLDGGPPKPAVVEPKEPTETKPPTP